MSVWGRGQTRRDDSHVGRPKTGYQPAIHTHLAGLNLEYPCSELLHESSCGAGIGWLNSLARGTVL